MKPTRAHFRERYGVMLSGGYGELTERLFRLGHMGPGSRSLYPVVAVSALGQWLGQGGGLLDDLHKSPIQLISVQAKAGSGRIDLQQATVQSAIFEATGQGDITLAQVLTNSPLNLPVPVRVSQTISPRRNRRP